MSGRLDLTPWARDALTADERRDVEDAVPDGWTLGVNLDRNRHQWVFWHRDPDKKTSHQLRVSGSMSLSAACFYALRHWHTAMGTTYTTDAQGWVRSITDAD